MLRAVTTICRAGQTLTAKKFPGTLAASRFYSHGKVETWEEIDQRYIKLFQRPDMDEWWLRKGMTEVYQLDCYPEPAVVIEALKAARKVNDYAAAVRFLEIMRFKANDRKDIWPWVLQEIQPTLTELGIDTPEELGYDKPEFYVPDESDWWPKEYYDIYKIKRWDDLPRS